MEPKVNLEPYKKDIDETKIDAKKINKEKKYSPLIEELTGIINLDEEFDFKEDYTNYLIEKHAPRMMNDE